VRFGTLILYLKHSAGYLIRQQPGEDAQFQTLLVEL
jgi:hypothetical protein